MRDEIITRFNLIVENDTNLQYGGEAIFKTFQNEYPPSLAQHNLPCVIWLPRQDTGYSSNGGYEYTTDVVFDGRVYLQPYGEGLSTIQNIRVLKLPDLLANAFLSRPLLEYNGQGLQNMRGKIQFRIVSDLARPVQYPVGASNYYWGFVMRITAPYQQTIELAN